MKKPVLIVAIFLVSTILIAQEKPQFKLDFENVKSSFKDIPTLRIHIEPYTLDKVKFRLAYANNLFTNAELQYQNHKVHNLQLAMNYSF